MELYYRNWLVILNPPVKAMIRADTDRGALQGALFREVSYIKLTIFCEGTFHRQPESTKPILAAPGINKTGAEQRGER